MVMVLKGNTTLELVKLIKKGSCYTLLVFFFLARNGNVRKGENDNESEGEYQERHGKERDEVRDVISRRVSSSLIQHIDPRKLICG